MSDWIDGTIGDLIQLSRGIDLPEQQRRPGSVPIMGSFGVTGYHDRPACSGPGVTVGRSGGSIGVVSYTVDDYWPLNTALYVKDFKGNDPRFCFYFLKTLDLARLNSGSAQPSLNRNFVHPVKTRFPGLDIQLKIAALLGALDDKIELNRRMNETLEAMARAIFKDWFVDFGPTRAKMEGRTPYLAPDFWSLFPDQLNHDGRPAGWAESTLGSMISILSGGTPKTSIAEYWDGTIPWFSVVDAPNDADAFVLDTQKHISEAGLRNSPASMLSEGAVIITARGTVGKLAIVGTAMAMNQSCYAIIGRGKLGSYGTYFLLKQTIGALQANTHGSVFDTITRQTFDAISVVKAGEDIWAAYENVVAPLMKRIKANGSENRTLAATRDLLLPRLMSGEIRIREAEAVVAAAA